MGKQLMDCWYIACKDHMTIVGPYHTADEAMSEAMIHTQAHMVGFMGAPPTGCVFLPYRGFVIIDEIEYEDAPKEDVQEIQERGIERLRKLREEKGN